MKFILPVFAIFSIIVASCGNDDEGDDGFIPARDRAEELIASTAEVEEYLQTHFYNYEEFAAPPAGFDYKIKFDTIAGENANKTKLIDQVDFKMVKDRVTDGVEYKLYYLKVIQGEGERPNFPDIARITYEGIYYQVEPEGEGGINRTKSELFDSSVVPVRFDLTQLVNGLQDALIEFNASTGFVIDPSGTVEYEGYGIGAVFVQSGLGYYVNPPTNSNIPVYSQLIFSFQLLETEIGDQDNDGIPSFMEDLNNNGLEEDDDTDADTIPNFLDADDDGDRRPTRDEIIINADGTITFPDTDGDGVPDHLDADS
ncbi:MAG: hypothetical protein ACSHW7_08770 [Patiriisocius sp.]|uniref:hypothetical protein n=1 Tax=Patiriisocius sp. TaxID=2822396 RepID=UPI003EF6EACC